MPYAPDFRKEMINIDTITHSGANANTVNVGFKPAFVHSRISDNSDGGFIFGEPTGLQLIHADDAGIPAIDSQGITSYVANGFTHGTANKFVINNKQTVYTCWKGSGNTGAVNTSGTITANVSANASVGFSLTKYTGNGTADSTIPHGLGKKPEAIFFLCTSEQQDNGVLFAEVPNKSQMKFANGDFLSSRNNNGRGQRTAAMDTDPTNTLITIGSHVSLNDNGETFIAVAWRSVKGISKIGFYSGTGGNVHLLCPRIYTGFKPSMIYIKNITSGSSPWRIVNLLTNSSDNDTASRRGFNPCSGDKDNWTGTNGTSRNEEVNIFSNGFSIVGQGSSINDSNKLYFYMAFAQESLVSTNNIPTTGV